MATKTISIELDVYDKLKAQKRDSRESFSQVLRRAHWGERSSTGVDLLNWIESRKKAKSVLDLDTLDRLSEAQKKDKLPDSKWK
ncbi:MAG TPA: antitoxin VapB family protein [Oligoflexia bacterium]|nr:antitoxin VapB family protein [Oligoflexia bacterium]HMP48954.1 antitoxin VapB family protein [Oligoflexia bacterium]